MFYVSVIPSINIFESFIDFKISIKSFISSFEINKVNPFPALTACFPLISLSNWFIASEAKFFTNPGKLSLAKGIARFVVTFLPKLHNILWRNATECWMNHFRQLCFTKFYIPGHIFSNDISYFSCFSC